MISRTLGNNKTRYCLTCHNEYKIDTTKGIV